MHPMGSSRNACHVTFSPLPWDNALAQLDLEAIGAKAGPATTPICVAALWRRNGQLERRPGPGAASSVTICLAVSCDYATNELDAGEG